MGGKLKVLLATEGTYPFHQGGVSTWCDILVNRLKSIDYVLFSVMMNPFVTQKFELPGSVELQKMPLWGTEEPCEHLSVPFADVYLSKKRTVSRVIEEEFIPLFSKLISEIIRQDNDPKVFASILYDLHYYFKRYEYKVSFKSELTWEVYKAMMLEATKKPEMRLVEPNVYELLQSLGWVYRFLAILNTPIPDVHVAHASAAAFCGIPCVLSKLEHDTPFLLTEHGVYLREQYIALGKNESSSFLKAFLIRFLHSVTTLNYHYADQVSPVCEYNMRWETELGLDEERIQVIYNGADANVFTKGPSLEEELLTVVMVARIDPNKDILTFLQAASIVKSYVPRVRFVVHGSVSVDAYYNECLALRKQLELEDDFHFAGHTSDMTGAYHSGHVIALSSVSEAFPYSVVEAMLTGKPVIATDVGGVKEAIGDTGILVPACDAEAFARELIELLTIPGKRADLGTRARERALQLFTMNKVLDLHLKSYIKLAVQGTEPNQLLPV